MDYVTENETLQASTETPSFLSAATRLGKVGLIVSNLQRSIEFYSGVIGLTLLIPSVEPPQ
jgi:catechol-2,3-dioxygenase